MQVKFDSSFADTQLARNCFVAKTFGGETHDLAFAHSQNLAVQRAVRSVNTAHYMPQSFHSKTCKEAIFRRNRSLPSTLTGKRSARADQEMTLIIGGTDAGGQGQPPWPQRRDDGACRLSARPAGLRTGRPALGQVEFGTASLHVRRVKQGTPSTHPILGDELRALPAASPWKASPDRNLSAIPRR